MTLGLLFNLSSYADEKVKIDLEGVITNLDNLSENRVNPKAEFCPDSKDKSFINFSPEHYKDPAGFHGMLFFGTQDSFYISHLPMFHKPHDYQAIVEVKLPEADKAKYLQALQGQKGIFTFAPNNNFILPEVIVQKKPIQGTLYQGHFEREGSELLTTELELIRVVFYKKIDPKEKKPRDKRFVLFGNENEYFLAHEVFGRPNVDEIISLHDPKSLSKKLSEDITINGVSYLEGVSVEKGYLKFKEGNLNQSLKFNEYYSETGDLK